MRKIRQASSFKRDLKRETKGRHSATLKAELSAIVAALAADGPMPERCRDHSLTGDWKGFRDCHVKPDLVLIYAKPDSDHLDLVRLGSHAELSL